MQLLKKIWIYIVQNHIHLMAGIIFICSILYILQENDVIKPQTIIYLNFVLFGVLVVWIRNIMKELCTDKWVVIYILLILCVLNKLYDKVVFQKLFHFEQQIFVVVGVVVAAFFCFFPLIVKKIKGMYKKIPADDIKHVMTESDQNLEKQYEERCKQQEYGSYYPAGKKEHQKSWKRTRVKRNEYRIRRSRIPRGGSKNRKNELTIIAEKKSFWFFILSLLIVLPIVMTLGIFIMYTKSEIEIEEIVENFTLQNAINIMLSFAITFMMMVFVTGMVVALVVKWIQIIREMATKKSRGNFYLLYALGLFLLSQYIFTNYQLTTDDFADILLNGKLFTFPLILSIIIPMFLVFTENIIIFTRGNEHIKKILDDSVKRTIDIVKGVFDALFLFVQFVTSDYLTAIMDLTKEDDYNSENKNTSSQCSRDRNGST